MKTYRNLYPQVYDFENLYLSYRAARRAKRDRAEVARFEARIEDQLFRLLAKTYDLLLWLAPATLKYPREHRFAPALRTRQARPPSSSTS